MCSRGVGGLDCRPGFPAHHGTTYRIGGRVPVPPEMLLISGKVAQTLDGVDGDAAPAEFDEPEVGEVPEDLRGGFAGGPDEVRRGPTGDARPGKRRQAEARR